MSRTHNWASSLEKDNPTLSELADGVDELAIPLKACLDVLDKICDGQMDDPPEFVPSAVMAAVALLDKAESIRYRLWEHLYGLAHAEGPNVVPFSR
jgi:hypothetical protein